MDFNEDFLQQVWRLRLFDHRHLRTADGESIGIEHPGMLNKDAGPDFYNAKLTIGGTHWAGNVELHLCASDWYLHKHEENRAYDNVILHVVYRNDRKVTRPDGTYLPVLSLEGRIPSHLYKNYEQLLTAPGRFPCANRLKTANQMVVLGQISRSVVERLEKRAVHILALADNLKGDWEEVTYRLLARSFGFKLNSVPFDLLAAALPRKILLWHRQNVLQTEALIFGQAGFLQQRFNDEYPRRLKQEYLFLKEKYQLDPLDISVWKFMRTRPQNFPTLRLAQFSGFISANTDLFASLIENPAPWKLDKKLKQVAVNGYWSSHFHFNKPAFNSVATMGASSAEKILINTVAPLLYAYGQFTDRQMMKEKSVRLLEQLRPEENVVVKAYQDAGINVKNAFDCQGLLQLHQHYCLPKKCLDCAIGLNILKR